MSHQAKAAQELVREVMRFAIAAAEQGVTVDGAPDPAAALYAYANASGDEPDAALPRRIADMVGVVPEGGAVVSKEWLDKASDAFQRSRLFPEESRSGVMALIALRNLFEKIVKVKPISRGTGS